MSSGDLLRAEVKSGSERGKKLDKMMKRGLLVPDSVVLDVIKEAMLANKDKSDGFLIDGYPSKLEQGTEFENQIIPSELVLYLDASEDTMKKRLKARAGSSGRNDDNDDSIKNRLEAFHENSEPIVKHYEKQKKLKKINADNKPNVVYDEIKKAMEEHAEARRQRKLNVHLIDECVDNIMQLVINQASHRQAVTENVSLSISNAIKDIVLHEMEECPEIGFSFVEYDHLEIYQGPTRLLDFIEDTPSDGQSNSNQKQEKDKKSALNVKDETEKHGEIIIRVKKGEKVTIKADDVTNDTIISHIIAGEIIIRNVDTNLLLKIEKGGFSDTIELNIVGQAYLKDVHGSITCKKFRGIVIVKNDL